jgi:hypothetical protein
MDCGGTGGDETLKPGMDEMEKTLSLKGYAEKKDFVSFFSEKSDHSERAWAKRVWRPLTYLFSIRKQI